ncbi:hypothetical protein AMTR_s00027p00170660 [Amborella trichopoda]|uniref:Uncharacterized protein n=1 Tax=Amborella trichopoda TaxID=13333 RepID=W1PRU2_AMBTC|nr:hypothetical protein AMTR_s00027p00170660 [Amborella trichopoda]
MREEADPSEQSEEIIPNETLNISQREEPSANWRLERPEVAASDERIEATVLRPSEVEARFELAESDNPVFEVASLEATIALAIVP